MQGKSHCHLIKDHKETRIFNHMINWLNIQVQGKEDFTQNPKLFMFHQIEYFNKQDTTGNSAGNRPGMVHRFFLDKMGLSPTTCQKHDQNFGRKSECWSKYMQSVKGKHYPWSFQLFNFYSTFLLFCINMPLLLFLVSTDFEEAKWNWNEWKWE